MQLWMSGELMRDVGDAYSKVLNIVEPTMNTVFRQRDYGEGLRQWAFIAMILGELGPPDYKEIKRYHKRDKSCEFRLRIDYDAFREAHLSERFTLVCEALLRSLSLMEDMKIPDVNVKALRDDFVSTARANGWLT
jgi:hypothetical protein